MQQRVLQIIPASGVNARFKDKDGTEESIPVICWRLYLLWEDEQTEADAIEIVVGMIIQQGTPWLIDVVADTEGFVGYEYD